MRTVDKIWVFLFLHVTLRHQFTVVLLIPNPAGSQSFSTEMETAQGPASRVCQKTPSIPSPSTDRPGDTLRTRTALVSLALPLSTQILGSQQPPAWGCFLGHSFPGGRGPRRRPIPLEHHKRLPLHVRRVSRRCCQERSPRAPLPQGTPPPGPSSHRLHFVLEAGNFPQCFVQDNFLSSPSRADVALPSKVSFFLSFFLSFFFGLFVFLGPHLRPAEAPRLGV